MIRHREPHLPTESHHNEKSFWTRLKPWILKVALLPALVAVGAIVSMYIPIPVPVEIKAEVNRVLLTAADSESNALLPHTAVCELDLRGFNEVQIPPGSILVADPGQADRKSGLMPENAWRPWQKNNSLVLRPSQRRFPAKVTLTTLGKCGPGLSVDGFHTGTDDVVLASPEKDYLSVDLRGAQRGSVALPNEFEMDVEYCNDPSTPFPTSVPEVRLRVRLPESTSRFLTFASSSSGMFAQLEFAPGQMQNAVISDFPVHRVEFTDLGPLEKPQSTLIGPGKISYYRKVIDLAAGDSLIAEQLKQFSVLKLGAGENEKSLSIQMKGQAGVLKSGRPTQPEDRRPTLFDALSGDKRVEAIGKAIKAVRDIFK
jgi:hypothetical protein